MAKTWTYRLGSARHTQAARQLLVFLLTAQPTSLLAQEQTPPSAAPSYPPNVPVNIINGDSLLAAATSTALPSSTDNANYATHNNGSSGSPEHGILNYYFLLLAVFIVIIALAYWSLARRRRRRINALRNNQQNALARDIETWPGLRRGAGGDIRLRMMRVRKRGSMREGRHRRRM